MTTEATPRPWRCFVAVPLPAGLREELREWASSSRASTDVDADWRWTDPAGLHITLAFLGATGPEVVPGITESLGVAVTETQPFSVGAGDLGGFPGGRHARVLWYGIQDEERRLGELAAAVRLATGTDVGSPFRPHVTLARARDRRGATLPLLPIETLPSARVPVAKIHLMRSHRGNGPARYESLGAINLGALAAARSPA